MDIDVRETDLAIVVSIDFDVDGKTAPGLQEQVLPLITAERPLILDMSRVGYMSSAGLRTLLATHRQATSSNARLLLSGLSPELRDTMEVTGFLSWFAIFDTLESALGSLK